MPKYELKPRKAREEYSFSSASVSSLNIPRGYVANQKPLPGEYPLVRLPDVFEMPSIPIRNGVYDSTIAMQREANSLGYRLQRLESLPYEGSSEGQTNKTNLGDMKPLNLKSFI